MEVSQSSVQKQAPTDYSTTMDCFETEPEKRAGEFFVGSVTRRYSKAITRRVNVDCRKEVSFPVGPVKKIHNRLPQGMPGFSKKLTDDGFLYVVDEGESSGSEKSIPCEDTTTEKVEPQKVAIDAKSITRDGRFSRLMGSAKSLGRSLKLSGRNLREASSSKRSAFSG